MKKQQQKHTPIIGKTKCFNNKPKLTLTYFNLINEIMESATGPSDPLVCSYA